MSQVANRDVAAQGSMHKRVASENPAVSQNDIVISLVGDEDQVQQNDMDDLQPFQTGFKQSEQKEPKFDDFEEPLEDEDYDTDRLPQVHEVLADIITTWSSVIPQINQLDLDSVINIEICKVTKACASQITDALKSQQGVKDLNMTKSEDIQKSFQEVETTLDKAFKDFCGFKGRFFALHDKVINKNMLTMSLEMLRTIRVNQSEAITDPNQFPKLGDDLNLQIRLNTNERRKFLDFAEELIISLQNKIEGVQIKQWKETYSQVNSKVEEMKAQISEISDSIKTLQPKKHEEYQKQAQLKRDIFKVNRGLTKFVDQFATKKANFEVQVQEYEDIKEQLSKLNLKSFKLPLKDQVVMTKLVVKLIKIQIKLNGEVADLIKFINDNLQALKNSNDDLKKELDALFNSISSESVDKFNDLLNKIKTDGRDLNKEIALIEKRIQGIKMTLANKDKFNFDQIGKLQAELSKQEGNLETVKAQRDSILKLADEISSNMIGMKAHQYAANIGSLEELQGNLDKLRDTQIPIINKELDKLELDIFRLEKEKAFSDSKDVKGIVEGIKSLYGDQSALIDAINSQIKKIKNDTIRLSKLITEPDVEVHDKINKLLILPLNEINERVNGKDSNDFNGIVNQRKDIISQLNDLVTQFNENQSKLNQAYKDGNQDEFNKYIAINDDLRNQAKDLEALINGQQEQLLEAKEELDNLEQIIIPQVESDIDTKYGHIERADQLFDTLTKDLDGKIDKTQAEMDELDSIIKMLEDSLANETNEDQKKELKEAIKKAKKLKNNLELKLIDLQNDKEQLQDLIGKLDTLDKDYVTLDEVQKVLEKIEKLNDKYAKKKREMGAAEDSESKELEDFKIEVEKLLNNERQRKLDQAKNKVKELENQVDLSNKHLEDDLENLEKLQEQISLIKTNEDTSVPVVKNKLKDLDLDVDQTQQKIEKHKGNIASLNGSLDKARDVLAKTETSNAGDIKDIDNMLNDLDISLNDHNNKRMEIDLSKEKCQAKFQDLLDELERQKMNGARVQEIQQTIDELDQMINGLQDQLNDLADPVSNFIQSCEEMLKDSGPDKAADYLQEKNEIETQLEAQKLSLENINNMAELFQKKKSYIENLKTTLTTPKLDLDKVLDDLDRERSELEEIQLQVVAQGDGIAQALRDFGDFWIPMNITHRVDDLENLNERIEVRLQEIQDLDQADKDFEGDKASEDEIKARIKTINDKMKIILQERDLHTNVLQNKLQKYDMAQILDLPLNPTIIQEVRELRLAIKDTMEKLDEISELEQELNTLLILQDMDNGIALLERQAQKLQARIKFTKGMCTKIDQAGKDLDGNYSNDEEKELIDAMAEEMPLVIENINANELELLSLLQALKELKQTKNPDDMKQIKDRFQELQKKIDSEEDFANNLEREVIEWNGQKKLVKRDEELENAGRTNEEIEVELGDEMREIKESIKAQEKKLAEDQSEKTKNDIMMLHQYYAELEDFQNKLQFAESDRRQLFQQFDLEVPLFVKQQRNLRLSETGKSKDQQRGAQEQLRYIIDRIKSEKPMSVYDMLGINCKYKKKIKGQLQVSSRLQDEYYDLIQRYAYLKQQLDKKPKVKYVFVKGDEIDRLFGDALIRRGCQVEVKRINVGIYMFGSRQIIAKIVNNKLMIRVGGGFMTIDEFITQYGPIEMLKYQQATAPRDGPNSTLRKSVSPSRKVVANNISKMRQKIALGIQTGDVMEEMTELNKYQSQNEVSVVETHDAKDQGYRVSKISGFGFQGLKNLEQEMLRKIGSQSAANYNQENAYNSAPQIGKKPPVSKTPANRSMVAGASPVKRTPGKSQNKNSRF